MTVPLKAMAFAIALTASTAAAAQASFQGLWTGWGHANREALKTEAEEARRVRADYEAADAARRARLQNEGRTLGERAAAAVRAGDCEEGERIAREAGDFALVEAVRAYCRSR